MIRPLRKRHLQIWTAWAILIPTGILFSWLVIPGTQPVKLLQGPDGKLLPQVVAGIERTHYSVNLRSNPGRTEWQLEWKNNWPLTVPSAVIYDVTAGSGFDSTEVKQPAGTGRLVGRIEARGDYSFPIIVDTVPAGQEKFLVYDFIHDRILDSFQFNLNPTRGIRSPL